MSDPRISRSRPRPDLKGRGRAAVVIAVLLALVGVMAGSSWTFYRSRAQNNQIRVMQQGLDLLRLERLVGFAAGEAEVATLWWMYAGEDERAWNEARAGFLAELSFAQDQLEAMETAEAWVPVVDRLQASAEKGLDYLAEPRSAAELRGWYESYPEDFAGIFPSDPGGRWSSLLQTTIKAQYAIYTAFDYAELALSRYAFSADVRPADDALVSVFTANAGNLEQIGMTTPDDFSPFAEDLDVDLAEAADERMGAIVAEMLESEGVRTLEGDLDYLVGRSRVTWFTEPGQVVALARTLARDLDQGGEAILSRAETVLSLAHVANRRRGKAAMAFGLMAFGLSSLLLVAVWRSRQREEDRLRSVAETDALTGIYNRFALFSREQERLRDPKGAPFALLHMDLDHFKEINDRYGHATGDAALIAFADVCQRVVRHSQDTLARIGGDEFVLVLHELGDPEAEAEAIAERIQTMLHEPFDLGGQTLVLKTSVGIAVSHEPVELDPLLHEADVALLEAKREKRSRHTVFERNLHGNLIHEIEGALEAGHVRPVFQPIFRATNQKLAGFEVLARWEREDGSVVPSSSFIRALQSFGGSGEWLRQVLEGIRGLTDESEEHPGWRFWVNITLTDLIAHGDVSIEDHIRASGVPFDRIGIEVTERICHADLTEARRALRAVRDLGVEVALDDLGSDGVPLRHLLDLPLDRVKIDGGLIRGLERSDRVRHLIQGLLAIAVHLDLKIVAEQIEAIEEQEVLVQLGVTYLQGNMLGRPVGLEGARDLIRRGPDGGDPSRAGDPHPVDSLHGVA